MRTLALLLLVLLAPLLLSSGCINPKPASAITSQESILNALTDVGLKAPPLPGDDVRGELTIATDDGGVLITLTEVPFDEVEKFFLNWLGKPYLSSVLTDNTRSILYHRKDFGIAVQINEMENAVQIIGIRPLFTY